MTRRKFVAALSGAAAAAFAMPLASATPPAIADDKLRGPIRRPHRVTILDSTVIHGDAVPNTLLWPEPVPGAQRSLMMGSILYRSFDAARVLEIANACKAGKPFPNHGLSWDGPNYGPRRFTLISLDLENPAIDTGPEAMKALIEPVVRAGFNVACYAPGQLEHVNVPQLTLTDWTPAKTPRMTADVKAAAEVNRGWTDLLWGIGCGSYFGAEKNDEATLIFLRNFIRLAKYIYPGRRTIATLCAHRETNWGGVGDLPRSLCKRIAAVVQEERVTCAEVWGRRSDANLYLLKCLGANVALATEVTREDFRSTMSP